MGVNPNSNHAPSKLIRFTHYWKQTQYIQRQNLFVMGLGLYSADLCTFVQNNRGGVKKMYKNAQKLNTYKDFRPLCLHLEFPNWISVLWTI